MADTMEKKAQRRVAFNTLGCKLNQYETDAIASRFIHEGYQVVDFHEAADAYIVNSCTVTNKADRKTRNTVNKADRLAAAAGSMVVLTGCFVDSHRQELEADGRSFVVDNDRKNSIFELVDGHLNGEIVHTESLQGDRFAYDASQQVFRTRGMVKIQDGCDNFCSFCIIPFVRGGAVSRPLADIVETAKQMLLDGYRELVLTGVNMSRYENAENNFSDVVQALLNLEGDYRLRISSIEPDQLDEHFIELMKHEKMTPHLHLCLQSGSERVLLQMRRQYTYAQYQEIVGRIRADLPDFNITTDLIVGFPGESDEDFNDSLQAVSELNFGHVHAFKYSKRQGTRAERMANQVSETVKNERSEALRQKSEEQKLAYRSQFIGREQRVLVERVWETENGFSAKGLGEHYIPVRFALPANRRAEQFVNEFIDVEITGLEPSEDPMLLGHIKA